MLQDRVQRSSAQARAEEIKGGSTGAVELFQNRIALFLIKEGGGQLGQVILGALGFNSPNIAQRHALHVERTAEKAYLLSDRI